MTSAKLEMIYGINAVNDMIKMRPKAIEQLYVLDSRQDQRIRGLVEAANTLAIAVKPCNSSTFNQLLDQLIQSQQLDQDSVNHQGVLLVCRPAQAQDEKFLAALLNRSEQPLLFLLLDGVTDPHNLGACLRSADAAGADAVIVPKDNAAGLTPVVRKVASGAAETTPLVVAKNLARCIKNLQEAGVWVMGATGDAEQSLFDLDLSAHTAIVMGAEGGGLRRLTSERCDSLFKIPMNGAVESLNVSVAAGICVFEVLRQRQQS